MMTDADLIDRIEAFCRRHRMAETRFGREAVAEASFLSSLRSGRSPSLKLANRVIEFMAERDKGADTTPVSGEAA